MRSVQKAFQKLGFDAELTNDKNTIRSASGIVLPGVGSFDDAAAELSNSNLVGSIVEAIALNKPFLGICLGYQLLFESSEEGKLQGFGLLRGKVKKFNFSGTAFSNYSVPHMGWNRLLIKHHSPILDDIKDGSMVYFAHSYFPDPEDGAIVSAETDYGVLFASSINKNNVFGVQFHPEKSGDIGLKILRNFAKLCLK
ncbi:MAG: glutamine amidotransferase [Candidatus Saganbacteria bacterium]|uniref:Imidazole glycerol phosphate synthase subunit HisH n=1 Tax=Candidatus Saganbacteria bacterium TaxID=2575572 RepID=A0A833L3V0_UNCSA|nr:MAG: glutamine amidotransferase [Candidatus Saganbacteria bacterium]